MSDELVEAAREKLLDGVETFRHADTGDLMCELMNDLDDFEAVVHRIGWAVALQEARRRMCGNSYGQPQCVDAGLAITKMCTNCARLTTLLAEVGDAMEKHE